MHSYIQFSVDDTLEILKELTTKRPVSIFQIEPFKFFKKLYMQYGIVVSFYVFFENEKGFTLADVTDKYKKEFEENSSWLKFGAHSTNKGTSFVKEDGVAEYRRIHAQLKRIVGETCIDTCFRPHFFVIREDVLKELKIQSLALGVHCPDDERKCHDFTAMEKEILTAEGFLLKDEILYIKTQLRLENINGDKMDDFFEGLKGKKILSIFTHEYCLEREEIRNRIEAVCKYAKERKVDWAFPVDILNKVTV